MSKSTTEQDKACAGLARAALFPKRMHRDVADTSHFPALLQLDLLRSKYLSTTPNASISYVFPRHVVVVRNLADDGIVQWNGEPDFDDNGHAAKFEVIPDRLSVSCTSQCDSLGISKSLRAFRRTTGGDDKGAEEIVLCSDRILKSDSRDKRYKGVAKDLPPQSYQAVEEVLAHQLVQVRHEATTSKEKAQVELEGAKAGECYYSRHSLDDKLQVKKGSRLQTGFSILPSAVQKWCMNKCLSVVAVEHLVAQQHETDQKEAQEAVQSELRRQQ